MNRIIATVVKVNGTVYARSEDGRMRALKAGDKIYESEVLITGDGSSVDLQMLDNSLVTIDQNREIRMIGAFVDQFKDVEEEKEQADEPREELLADWEYLDESGDEYPYVSHGYLRVEKGGAAPDAPDYRFVSINSEYDPSVEGRAADADPLMESRATHDPRLALSIAPPERVEQDEFVPILMEFEGTDRSFVRKEPEIGTPDNVIVDEDDLVPDGTDQSDDPSDSGSLGIAPGNESINTIFEGNSPPAGLTSEGKEVKYYVSPDGHTLIGYTGDLPPSGIPENDQKVFEAVINNPGSQTGEQSYTFALLDQLDHPDGDGENQLVLAFNFTVQYGGGGSIGSSFTVTVIDDVPVGLSESVTGYVDEDELPNGNSDGDSEDTVASGNIAGLFSIGADQPGSYAFKATVDGDPVRTTGGDNVYSQDSQVFFDYVSETVIYGRTAGGGDVFRIEITDPETGDYTFTLLDQLDHPNDNGDDNEVMELNLTGVVQALDYDLDPVDAVGTFIMTVEDDIPALTAEASSGSATVSGTVHEDALGNDGDTGGGSGGDVADQSVGNEEGTDASQVEQISGDGTTYASLSSLFKSGADEPLSYSFSTSQSSEITAELGGLTSRGDALSYSVDTSVPGEETLIATADLGGTDERVVFRLTIESGTGNWTFDLEDQLDHVVDTNNPDDQTQLKSNGTDSDPISSLNFTGLVDVTDADGDTVNLGTLAGETELFTITVENDIPALTAEASSGSATVSGTVHEDALGNDGDGDDASTGIE
ncbi:MAG: retention module-containing protein, partial [Chlorobiales bacterium]|nr:retention module-containing protein [Chlorobiales bacterium]